MSPFANPDVRVRFGESNIERFGFKYPMQNHEVAIKAARNAHNITKFVHWKTGQELVCTASYECKVVQYLNEHMVDFEWQSRTFKLPASEFGVRKTYRPDLYLNDAELWVEIKGYFRKDAKDKWDWFHSIHRKSELWDEQRLIELGIL
jgi:hypothetical protein